MIFGDSILIFDLFVKGKFSWQESYGAFSFSHSSIDYNSDQLKLTAMVSPPT
jgi:hypothetical protein